MFALDPATQRHPSDLLTPQGMAVALTKVSAPRRIGWRGSLQSAFSTAKRLLARYPSPSRPVAYAWVPNRLWQRHSALICVLAEDNAASEDLHQWIGSQRSPTQAREHPG
jgi:hypothetical protein